MASVFWSSMSKAGTQTADIRRARQVGGCTRPALSCFHHLALNLLPAPKGRLWYAQPLPTENWALPPSVKTRWGCPIPSPKCPVHAHSPPSSSSRKLMQGKYPARASKEVERLPRLCERCMERTPAPAPAPRQPWRPILDPDPLFPRYKIRGVLAAGRGRGAPAALRGSARPGWGDAPGLWGQGAGRGAAGKPVWPRRARRSRGGHPARPPAPRPSRQSAPFGRRRHLGGQNPGAPPPRRAPLLPLLLPEPRRLGSEDCPEPEATRGMGSLSARLSLLGSPVGVGDHSSGLLPRRSLSKDRTRSAPHKGRRPGLACQVSQKVLDKRKFSVFTFFILKAKAGAKVMMAKLRWGGVVALALHLADSGSLAWHPSPRVPVQLGVIPEQSARRTRPPPPPRAPPGVAQKTKQAKLRRQRKSERYTEK